MTWVWLAEEGTPLHTCVRYYLGLVGREASDAAAPELIAGWGFGLRVKRRP